eukprot:ANDGO_05784.mRNA.1 Flavohemoprotein
MTRSMNPEAIKIVKATAGVVAKHADDITRTFYRSMFENNPEVKAFFNPAHQVTLAQPRALADAVIAYASNIENLAPLASAVEVIAQKHCSFDIQPSHYDIVGANLMGAISKVLGSALTPEVAGAWKEAYDQLAGICINREKEICKEMRSMPGGWNGKRSFVLQKKVPESASITSFYWTPEDAGQVPRHKAGQYTAVHPKEIPGFPSPIAPRNYSLSSAPGSAALRISVKKEPRNHVEAPDGIISNYLHQHVREGDVMDFSAPCGEFFLHKDKLKDRPAVFIAGGVGLTPLLSMLHDAGTSSFAQNLSWLHAVRDGSHMPQHLREEVEQVAARHGSTKVHYAYQNPRPEDKGRYHVEGLLSAESAILLSGGNTDADFYLCGPRAFLVDMVRGLRQQGVKEDRLHYEFFGPKPRFDGQRA